MKIVIPILWCYKEPIETFSWVLYVKNSRKYKSCNIIFYGVTFLKQGYKPIYTLEMAAKGGSLTFCLVSFSFLLYLDMSKIFSS